MNAEFKAMSLRTQHALARDIRSEREAAAACDARSEALIVVEGIRRVARRGGMFARGQAMVEFAIIGSVALIVLLVGIQLALVGQAALAVTQLSYVGARYASVHPAYTLPQVQSYMTNTTNGVASPTLLNNGGADLHITMPTPCGSPSYGTQVTITIQYNLASKLFLPNPFLGISFPTTVQSTQTAFCEGGAP